MTIVKALINIDFDTNESIKTNLRLKRLQRQTDITKEDAMGEMVKERHELEALLNQKKMTFKELTNFLTKK